MNFRPPQLCRLGVHEFYLPVCQDRVRALKAQSLDCLGNLYTRALIPSEFTMAMRTVGALLGIR